MKLRIPRPHLETYKKNKRLNTPDFNVMAKKRREKAKRAAKSRQRNQRK